MFRATADQPDEHRPSAAHAGGACPTVRVWDPVVRLSHWALVAAVTVAAVTGLLADASWIDVHVGAGAAMAGLVAARVVWGFLGPGSARFTGFVVGPGAVLTHLRELRAGTAGRHLGHNPLGAAMVLALLAIAAGLAVTGLVALGGVLKAGPLAFATGYADGRAALAVHELLAYGLLALIALHVAGVVFESRRSRENLGRAMLTGRKPARPGDHVPAARPARPVAAAALSLGILGVAAAAIGALTDRPALGVPTAAPDPAYAQECAACHVAYHPSLLPRASWSALFDGLGDHFGEDAGLDPATTARLRTWVLANAAEAYDTKAANRLRAVEPAAPFSITETRFWRRTHADIPGTVFAGPAVVSKGNCEACHADARAGRFYPGNIHIPSPAPTEARP
ncbi:cytochrome b/b6 domain-containing protein [Thalassobaculum sp.]|uniref:cytochrome b/b6 domain-containing protein n=1 Tax=Thalassobaculum sp. TaxID=2022740 RepID=UPI0032EF54CB